MSKSTITLTKDQLALVKDGKRVMLCTVLREQFKDTIMIRGQVIKVELAYWCDCNKHLLQYPKDTVLGVREKWSMEEHFDTDIGYHYKYCYEAGMYTGELRKFHAKGLSFHSPQTCPKMLSELMRKWWM